MFSMFFNNYFEGFCLVFESQKMNKRLETHRTREKLPHCEIRFIVGLFQVLNCRVMTSYLPLDWMFGSVS